MRDKIPIKKRNDNYGINAILGSMELSEIYSKGLSDYIDSYLAAHGCLPEISLSYAFNTSDKKITSIALSLGRAVKDE